MTRKDSVITGRILSGIDVDSLVDLAWRLQQVYRGYVAIATKRVPRFCEAQLD